MSEAARLQPYLPRLVRYWDKDAPGEMHRAIEGSMLFVDISGFTKMSERLARHGKVGAEEVTDVIDDTFGRLLPEAYAFGANLLKFGGDALLLLFTNEGHALRSCAAALNMRRTLRQIAAFRTTAGQVSLRMSVGVHSGTFDFFLVGGSHRELIVAGPAATKTVEMESTATAGQILVSPATAEALPKANRGRVIGPGILLRGELEGIDQVDFRAATSPEIDLAPFIPIALREFLISGGVDAGHHPAAVAFLMYSGFDHLVDTAGASEAAGALDILVRTVQEAVDHRGVTFLATDIAPDGGKMILASGVPATSGNDEEQMLLTLRAIINSKPEIAIQIGVTSGHVFAGEVGPPYRRTYTVMGDTVNLAARLGARAQSGQILTTEELLAMSRTMFSATPLEPITLKGKKKPVRPFIVEEAHGSRAQLVEASLPLLGRDAELAAMLAAWETAQTGTGAAIEVTAEPGMGKSRLLEEFVARAGTTSIVRAECRLYQSATPYFPLRTLFTTVFGLDGLTPHEGVAALRALVASRAPDLAPWLSLIGVPLDLHIEESPEVRQLEEEFRRLRTQEVVSRLAATVVTEPVIFVIEDTHWMDEASGDLLGTMMRHWGDTPGLLCLTRRPGDDGFSLPEGALGTRIELKPLGVEDAEALIIAASESAPLMPSQVATLAKRAEGSPLFLIELLQALRHGGDVEELPHSVEGLIGARIDKLPAPDRNLLRRVAVLGAGFRFEHAEAVLHEPELGERWQARALRRLREFLTIDESGWVQFRHALIRDVAYGALPYRIRQALHARIGDSIRESGGQDAAAQAALLSLHYSQAGRWPEAWTYSRVAGDNAKRIYANLEAAVFYRRALAAARHLPDADSHVQARVAESLGDVLELGGLFQESVEAFRRAGGLSEEPVLCADLMLKRARARLRLGSFRAAMRDLGSGRKTIAQETSQEARRAKARLDSFTAFVRLTQQRPRAAIELAEIAKTEAQLAGEQEALARSYSVLDGAYSLLGQPNKAVYGHLALEIYEALGDQAAIAVVTNNLGAQAYFEGRWMEALDYYQRAQDAFRRAGNEPETASAASNIGEVFVSQGLYSAAKPLLSEAIRVLRAHRLIDMALFAEIQDARLGLMTGKVEESVERLSALRAEATDLGFAHWSIEAALYRAIGLIKQGQHSMALEEASDVGQGDGDLDVYACMQSRVRASALLGLGRLEEAQTETEAGLKLADERGLMYEKALLLRLKADVVRAGGGDPAEVLEEANGLLQSLGVIQTG